MKKLTETFATVKSSIMETLSGPTGDKLTGHLYYLAAVLYFSALRKVLKQAIPNIKRESRVGMKVWYIVITVIMTVAYSTYVVSSISTGDMCMESYASRKRDLEVFEDLQNEESDDDFDEIKRE